MTVILQEPQDLKDMMMKVFREGLEGLVLKDVNVSKQYHTDYLSSWKSRLGLSHLKGYGWRCLTSTNLTNPLCNSNYSLWLGIQHPFKLLITLLTKQIVDVVGLKSTAHYICDQLGKQCYRQFKGMLYTLA